MKLLLILSILISYCLAQYGPVIYANQTSSLGISGSNFTVSGYNFISNSQNQSYCVWSLFGSYRANVIDNNTVICTIPSVNNLTISNLEIANHLNANGQEFSVFSNPICVHIHTPNNILMLGNFTPNYPVSGDPIYVYLSQGEFSDNSTNNLCKFENITVYAYKDNSSNAFCYVPYTTDGVQTISVSANGGQTWSNSLVFTFRQVNVTQFSPINGTYNTQVNLYGSFSPNKMYQLMCKFVNYFNSSYNATSYGRYYSDNLISCNVPLLNYTSTYQIYVSEDLGYHWSLVTYNFFTYTPHGHNVTTPVLNRTAVVDFATNQNIIHGYYFSPSTVCKLVNTYESYPYSNNTANAPSFNVTFVNSMVITVGLNFHNISTYAQYGIVCSNDGVTFSSPSNITFAPSLFYINPFYSAPGTLETVMGVGFQNLGGRQQATCKTYFQDTVSTINLMIYNGQTGRFFSPIYGLYTGYINVSCSNDGIHFSSINATYYITNKPVIYHHARNWFWYFVPFFVVCLVISALAARRRRMRNQNNNNNNNNNGTVISPLENTQITLDDSTSSSSINMTPTPTSQPIYQPVQVINSVNQVPQQQQQQQQQQFQQMQPVYPYPQQQFHVYPNNLYPQPIVVTNPPIYVPQVQRPNNQN